jgi:hypothetical protein
MSIFPRIHHPPVGFPLVLCIHGGGWMGGDSHRNGPFVDFPGVLASLSARGYVVASIEYRLSSEAQFHAQAQDVKAAIGFFRLNALKYGIDPARAAAWGLSAGGHLAGLDPVSCKALEPMEMSKPVVLPRAFPTACRVVSPGTAHSTWPRSRSRRER